MDITLGERDLNALCAEGCVYFIPYLAFNILYLECVGRPEEQLEIKG